MPMPLSTRRVLLRVVVLVQLVVLALAAWSVSELVALDGQIPPGMVFLVAAMLACTAVALRATFRRSDGLRGHRFAFMASEGACALLPVLAENVWGVISDASRGAATSGIVEGMIGLELLLAACVAGVAALVAPFLLAAPPESREDSPYEKGLALWAAVGLVMTIAIGGVYKMRYDETHSPKFLLDRLFTSDNPVQQRLTAVRLVESGVPSDPKYQPMLFEMATNGPVMEKTWSSYLLIAGKVDDGRAMSSLRQLIGGFATIRAVETLVLLGAAAEPALPELARVMRQKTDDALTAEMQIRAADALAQIGPPAIETVPALVGKLGEKDYWELRISAAAAIDRIDEGYAARCVIGAPSVLDALPTEQSEVTLKPECVP